MATPLRRLALSRRTLLRGAGVSLALPWLDAMRPALAPLPPRPLRTLFVFAPNGVHMAHWTPSRTGTGYDLPSILAPLKALRSRVTVLSGLEIDGGWSHGDGPGDHARAAASFLTCAHPFKTGGADLRVGQSVDQRLAEQLGQATAFPSLELGLEDGRSAGACDSGYACAYSNNVAWRTPSTPVAKETDPRQVMQRLFGDSRAAAESARQRARLASVLDLALDDAKSLRGRVSPADRAKLDEYFDAVRAVEQRITRIEDRDAAIRIDLARETDELEKALSDGKGGRARAMYELLRLAFQTDRTRIATLMLGNAGSNSSHRFLGAPEGHHELSHHRKDADKLEKIRRIDVFRVERLAEALASLAAVDDGDRDLLAHTLVVYGSGISDGNRHNHDDLPVLVAGGDAHGMRTGRHVQLSPKTPMANLYLSILHAHGVRDTAFADSTGPLAEL